MAARYELEVKITSAKELKNVNWRHGELKPYAVVWVEPQTKCSTYAAAVAGGASCRWNQKLVIPFATPVEESALHVDILHDGAAADTTPLVGSARIALGDLIGGDAGGFARRTLQLERASGRPQGSVDVAVTLRDLAAALDDHDVDDEYFEYEEMDVAVFP